MEDLEHSLDLALGHQRNREIGDEPLALEQGSAPQLSPLVASILPWMRRRSIAANRRVLHPGKDACG